MQVALFGYGYMGSLLYKFLKQNQDISKIYIIDPNPRKTPENGEKIYSSFEELPKDHKVQSAFIASNSCTHFDILKKVAQNGIRNIFCEKPMCLNRREYQDLFKVMPQDSHVVVDYILRASPAVLAFQDKARALQEQGFKLRQANVVYGKDKSQDPRRFRDVGVYEELYHVWDLCFNNMLIDDVKSIKTLKNIYYPDPEIQGRCLAHRFRYLVETDKGNKSFLNIYSDFKMPMRHRGFAFFFYNGKQKETLSLIFDQGVNDRCIHVDNNGIETVLDFQSNKKLETKINDTVHYFKTGEKAPYFHDHVTSFKSHVILENMGQTTALNKSALLERILTKERTTNQRG